MSDDKKAIPAANEDRGSREIITDNRKGYTPTETTSELPTPPAGGSGEKSDD